MMSSHDSALRALQCHFSWDLNCPDIMLLRLKDKLIDVCPSESTPWRGQIYNLQGFLEAKLGSLSKALTLFTLASENLTGPELLVNYSNLSWLHHERGEAEQSQEYLKKVEALNREYPTERDRPHPEVQAEKAFVLMKLSFQQKLLAVELFEEALKQEQRPEWRSSQVIAISSAHKHKEDEVGDEVLLKMKQALQDDPENLYVNAVYLKHRALRGEDMREEMDELANKVLPTSNSSYSGFKVVIRFYRTMKDLDDAIFWADKALNLHPDSRYVIRCAAICYKWRVLFQNNTNRRAARNLLERAVYLTRKVIEMYPQTALGKEIDLADLYAKSDRRKAKEMYSELLEREMEPPEKQMLFNRYAKYLNYLCRERNKSIKYHWKAVRIPVESFFRQNSVEKLHFLTGLRVEEILAQVDDSEAAAYDEVHG